MDRNPLSISYLFWLTYIHVQLKYVATAGSSNGDRVAKLKISPVGIDERTHGPGEENLLDLPDHDAVRAIIHRVDVTAQKACLSVR